MSTKISTFKCLKYKVIKTLLMCKGLQNLQSTKRKCFFLFPRWFLTRKSVLTSTLRTSLCRQQALYKIDKLFLDEYISSFEKAPKKVIIDCDDTNANTYGAQQFTLFNAYSPVGGVV